jgi:hypothetical protein
MDPIAALSIAKTAGELGKKLYTVAKKLKDREAQQEVQEIVDRLHELKQSASELEDENRDLREKLRFKSDEYEFRTPFRYHRAHPDQPLCVKCFTKNIEAQMGEPFRTGEHREYRRCLVCDDLKLVSPVEAPSFSTLVPDHPF